MRRSRARSVLVAFIIIATSAALLWGLYQGTQAVMAGRITAGHLGQTVVYVIILASAFAVLGEVYGDLLRAAGATERLMELLDTHSPIRSPAAAQHGTAPATGSTVGVRPGGFPLPVAPDARGAAAASRCTVAAGETVALVGPSGAGKSTVFQLLLRFYDPQRGSIVLNGVPTRDLALADLRQHIGIVPQDAVIFSANAMENIRYGKPARQRRRGQGRSARGLCRRASSAACRRATTPSWANAACA